MQRLAHRTLVWTWGVDVVGKAGDQVGKYVILILFPFCFIIFRLVEHKTHKCRRVFSVSLFGFGFTSRPVAAQHRKREYEQTALFNVTEQLRLEGEVWKPRNL